MAVQKKRSSNNTDRRVKRTKKALRDALFELLEKKKINQITVTELTTLADVNRATFYFYYTDLEDMLEQIQNEAYHTFSEVLAEAQKPMTTVEGFTQYVERYLEFCKSHEVLCRFIINNEANTNLNEKIHQLKLKNLPNSKEFFADASPARYSTTFAINAVTGVIIEWMNDGMECPVHELAEYLAKLFLNGYIDSRPPFDKN